MTAIQEVGLRSLLLGQCRPGGAATALGTYRVCVGEMPDRTIGAVIVAELCCDATGKHLGWHLPAQLSLKITLAGSDPKIGRRVEVHGGLTLHDLHYVIQCVFDWTDAHLYHFLVPPGGKLTRAALRDATRYHVLPPDPFFADEGNGDASADEALIGQIFTAD